MKQPKKMFIALKQNAPALNTSVTKINRIYTQGQHARCQYQCKRAVSFPSTYTITAVDTVDAQRSVPLDLHANAQSKSKPYNINHRWTWVGPTNKRTTPPPPSCASYRFSNKTTMWPRKAHLRLAGRQNFARANSRRRPPQECLGGGKPPLRIAVSLRDGLIPWCSLLRANCQLARWNDPARSTDRNRMQNRTAENG
jgi:hypothetical protein